MAREKKFSTQEIFKETNSLLLKHGYEGFSFSLLAEALHVSRAAIYKHYMNKEELIIDYMVSEMEKILSDLQEIDSTADFPSQLDQLLTLIFAYSDIHQILGMAHQIQENSSDISMKKNQLQKLHLDMYSQLQSLINLGKRENLLSEKLPNDVILGFIFQSIAIPNHRGIPQEEWLHYIKEVVGHGIYKIK
ncbi:TetR/AcrR family transcriptional regulator [Peribacillus sp. NPDC076916]|uniref:TetR/AcrR family transcriptional regulator n=1 Tax=Peribacillus sp. NPDC076916 TaxID=3390608 RepID=UPI003D014B42